MSDADLDGIQQVVGITVGGECDEESFRIESPDLPGHGKAIHPGQSDVGDHDLRLHGVKQRQPRHAVHCHMDIQITIVPAEEVTSDLPGISLILHEHERNIRGSAYGNRHDSSHSRVK